jgi:hypothetical protein
VKVITAVNRSSAQFKADLLRSRCDSVSAIVSEVQRHWRPDSLSVKSHAKSDSATAAATDEQSNDGESVGDSSDAGSVRKQMQFLGSGSGVAFVDSIDFRTVHSALVPLLNQAFDSFQARPQPVSLCIESVRTRLMLNRTYTDTDSDSNTGAAAGAKTAAKTGTKTGAKKEAAWPKIVRQSVFLAQCVKPHLLQTLLAPAAGAGAVSAPAAEVIDHVCALVVDRLARYGSIVKLSASRNNANSDSKSNDTNSSVTSNNNVSTLAVTAATATVG